MCTGDVQSRGHCELWVSSDFVRNPPQGLEVNTEELFSNGNCNNAATFNDNKGSCSGGSGAAASGSSSAAAPSATSVASSSAATPAPTSAGSCSWSGHCAGATCSSDDDCSDSLICNSGKCGS